MYVLFSFDATILVNKDFIVLFHILLI